MDGVLGTGSMWRLPHPNSRCGRLAVEPHTSQQQSVRRRSAGAAAFLTATITLGALLSRIGLLLALCLTYSATPTLGAKQSVKNVEASLLRVLVLNGNNITSGTGFVVAPGGYVITSNHVVARTGKAKSLKIQLHRDQSSSDGYLAQVVAVSKNRDLALLKAPGLDAPPLPLSLALVQREDRVSAVGFPAAADAIDRGADAIFISSRTVGNVSRTFSADWRNSGQKIEIVQHSAEIADGSSGGPLINPCGQVVGVNMAYAAAGRAPAPGQRGNAAPEISAGGVTFYSVASAELMLFLRETQQSALPQLSIKASSAPCAVNAATGSWRSVILLAAMLVSLALVAVLLYRPGLISKPALATGGGAETVVIADKPQTGGWFGGLRANLRRIVRGRTTENIDTMTPIPVTQTVHPNRIRPSYFLASELYPDAPHIALSSSVLESAEGLIVGRIIGESSLIIDTPDISRTHARLRATPGAYGIHVEDLGSKNGTQINGEAISPFWPRPISVGDAVAFGDTTYRLFDERQHQPDAAGNAPPNPAHALFLTGAIPGSQHTLMIPLDRDFIQQRLGGMAVIGRTNELCNIVVDHLSLSRSGHAKILLRDQDFLIADLGSTNGTYVNGRRLHPGQETVLEKGMDLRLGDIELVIQ